jgi:exopolysaccharide biosynthesis polyprenyl glycosylphosphotransferase
MFRGKFGFINSIFLIGFDVLVLVLAFLLAYTLRIHLPMFKAIQSWQDYLGPLAILIVACIVFLGACGLYRDVRDLSLLEEYANIIKALTYAFLLSLTLTFFFKFYERSRVLAVIYWGLAVCAMLTGRFFYYQGLRWLRARGFNQFHVAVVGSPKKVRGVAELFNQHPQLGFKIVTTQHLSARSGSAEKKWEASLEEEILRRFRQQEIQGVILAESVKNYEALQQLSAWLKWHKIPVRNITEEFDLAGLKLGAAENMESMLLSLSEGQINSGYKVVKRFMDEMLGLVALILLSPLGFIIMLAIKLESRGPVFFRQERIGFQGKPFKMLKFRSMYVNTPAYAKTPRSSRDPRITRVGAILRKTSLDELPQLLNVLKGEMSLVGPRPEMPFIVEKYKPIYRYRFLVQPGLTGLWQISGRSDKPLEENIKYDLYYIKNLSLALDLVILLRTIPAVLFGRGAY